MSANKDDSGAGQKPTQPKKAAACKAAAPKKPLARPFRFLDLPPELRNAIYEYAFTNDTTDAVLRARSRGTLLSQSALLRVSRQFRAEACSAMYLTAPRITAHVQNLDFSHIVTFLNKLSERELGALPKVHAAVATDRRIEVKIHITDACQSTPDMLSRWLLRCEHPTKKGTRIAMSYTVYVDTVFHTRVPSGFPRRVYGKDAAGRVHKAQKEVLERYRKAQVTQGRSYEELKKIVAALQFPRLEAAAAAQWRKISKLSEELLSS